MNPRPISDISEFDLAFNRARYKNELAEGIYRLMIRQRVSRRALGEMLGLSKGRISQMLSGEVNFQADTIADIFLVLGRAAHLTLGTDLHEVRILVDEADEPSKTALTGESHYGKEVNDIPKWRDIKVSEVFYKGDPGYGRTDSTAYPTGHEARTAARVVRSHAHCTIGR